MDLALDAGISARHLSFVETGRSRPSRGLLLALAEQLTVRYAPLPAGYSQGVPLIFLMIFLLVRPTGLLKAKA